MNKAARLCPLLLLLLLSQASGANLVRNGSFEVPGGWYPYGTPGSENESTDKAVANHYVSTNGAFSHGSQSIYFRSRLISDPFWLTNGHYVLSFSARASSAKTIRVGVVPTWRVVFDPTNAADGTIITLHQHSITTSWATYTSRVTVSGASVTGATTNGMHCIRFYDLSLGPVWIDAVQVETGTVATAFAPISPIEVGMDTADQANVLFLSDAKTLRFKFWSEMPSVTNVICPYKLVNLWNTNLTSGSGEISSNALPAGGTTINLTLPPLWGWIRATCYITNLANTLDETTIAMLPYASQTGKNPDGLLGIHPNWSAYILNDLRRVGFTRARIFSPTSDARWANLFPTLATTNLLAGGAWYLDYILSNFVSSDLIPWIVLTPDDHSWHPETNASLQVMIGDFTNYAGRVAHRYRGGQVYSNMVYEIINEPQLPPRPAVELYLPGGAQIYANIYTQTVALLKSIDPAIQVVAFGGVSQADQGTSYWARISTPAKEQTSFLAFHFYPHTSGEHDPNLTEDESSYTTANVADWRREFGAVTNKSWNTETYVGDAGAYHTKPFSYPYWYDNFQAGVGGVDDQGWEDNMAWFQEVDNRGHVPSLDRITYMFCRSVGEGFSHVNIQHGSGITESQFSAPHPTVYEINSTFKPWTVALLVAANHALKTPGLGRIYHTNDPPDALTFYVESYGHTNTLGNVASIWCPDRGSRRLGLTNPAVALYDTFWNLVSTNSTNIYINRSVQYLVSGSLSYAQFAATIGASAVFTNADTIAPGLTIDYSPIGTQTVWGGVSNLFKSTAIDNALLTYGNMAGTTISNVNVFYRWTLNDGSTWSPWGVTNHFLHSFASEDMYRVGFQAKDIAGNTSPTAYTPYFGTLEELPPPAPARDIHVNTLNVGTITVVAP